MKALSPISGKAVTMSPMTSPKAVMKAAMIQYMKDKRTKWGFKVWVVADMSGYTIDFNVYTGKSEQYSDYGLSHNVAMKLLEPFWFQGFVDNFYSSPVLFESLMEVGICVPRHCVSIAAVSLMLSSN